MSRTSVGKAIYFILAADATVAGIIGAKIYPVTAPQLVEVPFVVYSLVAINPYDTKDRPTSVDQVRVQVDCYEKTYMKAEVLAGAVRDALDAYPIGATVNGVKLDGIKYETENDALDEAQDIFRKSADYLIRVKY